MIEQESPAVTVHRCAERQFILEGYDGLYADIPLPEIDAELSLAEIYERVTFTPEPDPEDS